MKITIEENGGNCREIETKCAHVVYMNDDNSVDCYVGYEEADFNACVRMAHAVKKSSGAMLEEIFKMTRERLDGEQ